jgi:hypothetical protein
MLKVEMRLLEMVEDGIDPRNTFVAVVYFRM